MWGGQLFSKNFILSHPKTDGQTESEAYEPTVHKHRCAQKDIFL